MYLNFKGTPKQFFDVTTSSLYVKQDGVKIESAIYEPYEYAR